jgi:hypothetical protein
MKFEINLTEEEYNELMKRFGNLGTPEVDGVNGAVKRMILAVSKFREIYELPDVVRSRELYRDEDVVVTIRGEDGEVNLTRYDKKGAVKTCETILVLNPDKLPKSVEHLTFKKK